jgi:hypothetical protein
MILTVRSKVSKLPKDNYSVAACDGCERRCAKSKQKGQTGDKGRDAAIKAAHAIGWKDHLEADTNRRRRKMSWIVQLLCPKCQAKKAAASTPRIGAAS